MISTSFQVADCVSFSLAAGVYSTLSNANITSGRNEFGSLLTGFSAAPPPSTSIYSCAIGSYLSTRAEVVQVAETQTAIVS